MPKLTKKFIESNIRFPESGHVFYSDSELPGFWLRVTPRRKFYIVQWTSAGLKRSITIGSCDSIEPEQARAEAAKILAAVSDPRQCLEQSGEQIPHITLNSVFDKYMTVRTLRPSTRRVYREVVERCLRDWLEIPIHEITKAMIETRHRDLCHKTRYGTDNKGDANFAMRVLRAVCRSLRNIRWAADYLCKSCPTSISE